MRDAPQTRVVLFDADCAFCTGSVRWIIRRDPRGVFRFAPLRSAYASRQLAARGASADALPDSMILLDAEGVHVRSTAALRIGRGLRFPWGLLARLGLLVPRGLRDGVYGAVARRRRMLGGRACWVPSDAERERVVVENGAELHVGDGLAAGVGSGARPSG